MREVEPEMFSADRSAAAENRRTLEHVRKLSDIAGPVVRQELLGRLRIERKTGSSELPANADEQVLRKWRDVQAALTKRRQLNRKDRKPVIEIRSKFAAA